MTHKFVVDCSEPAADDIFDIAAFEKFLHDRIKIGGKTGVLGDQVSITCEQSQVTVTSKVHMSKRYIKVNKRQQHGRNVKRERISEAENDEGHDNAGRDRIGGSDAMRSMQCDK